MKDKEAYLLAAVQKQLEEDKVLAIAAAAKKTDFIQTVDRSEDLYEHLQDLLDHVALEAGATAGYLGKVAEPIKGIKDGLPEDADEFDHLIDDAKEQIQWQYATSDFGFLYEKTLE